VCRMPACLYPKHAVGYHLPGFLMLSREHSRPSRGLCLADVNGTVLRMVKQEAGFGERMELVLEIKSGGVV
jgi:hypothetical protein